MSRLIETTEALRIIREALDKHGPTPPTTATEFLLSRREIATMAAVFQPRDRDRMYVADRKHTQNLADAIGKNPNRPNYLDRITVWWGGDRYFVIDGHHRLDAYAAQGVREAIPCKLFTGSLDEAMAYSGFANSKDRLPMSKTDKLNRAWLLTLETKLPKRTIARSCSVSERTVANMRSVRDQLLADPENTKADLISGGWKRASLKAQGVEFDGSDWDPDAALRKRAETYRERLYKVLGNKPQTDPEAFALALVLSDERFPGVLMQTAAWGEAFREAVVALKEEGDTEAAVAAAALIERAEQWEDAACDY